MALVVVTLVVVTLELAVKQTNTCSPSVLTVRCSYQGQAQVKANEHRSVDLVSIFVSEVTRSQIDLPT